MINESYEKIKYLILDFVQNKIKPLSLFKLYLIHKEQI
jgi:hypothetical protein